MLYAIEVRKLYWVECESEDQANSMSSLDVAEKGSLKTIDVATIECVDEGVVNGDAS